MKIQLNHDATTQPAEEVKPVETPKRTPAKIIITEHEPFESNMECYFGTSADLAMTISHLFEDAFPDCVGCKICINNGNDNITRAAGINPGAAYVSLFFRDNVMKKGDNRYKNVERINKETDNRDVGATLMAMSGSPNNFKVTKETYEMLDDFMCVKNPNWYVLTSEETQPRMDYGDREEILVRIDGIDLTRVITAIYGTIDDDGERYEYNVIVNLPIANRIDEYVMQVTRVKKSLVRKLGNTLSGRGAYTAYYG